MDVYHEAAQILTRANEKEGTLKTLVYSSAYKNLRQLFALVSECVKFQAVLEEVLSHCSDIFLDETLINGDRQLAVVLLYEFLIGRGFGKAGYIRKVIVKHKSDIKAACQMTLQNHNSKSLPDIVNGKQATPSKIPRYARVNLVKCTLQEAVEKLVSEGWIYQGTLDPKSFKAEIGNLTEDMFASDSLLKDLLVFPVGTDLHNHPLVLSGVLVLQDKASCIPAHVLDPEPGSVVLDCCAAPGNKTCHLASLIGDNGRVIALDRDLSRMRTMKSLLERSGFTCIELIHQDFLTISPSSEDASQIKWILVDPSCSGSGMPGARVCPSDDQVDAWRLESLKRFQISILKHALRFPNVQRVVYSTCSVHQQENEEVVEEVMEHVQEYFRFKSVFPQLSDCRGLKQFLHHKHFLRLSSQYLTLGFFVACFERIKSREKPGEDKALLRTQEVKEDVYHGDPAVTVDESSKKKRKRKEPDDSTLTKEKKIRMISTTDETNELNDPIENEDKMRQAKRHKKKHKKEKGEESQVDTQTVLGDEGTEESHCSYANDVESSKQFHSKSTQETAFVTDSLQEETLLREKKEKKKKKRKKGKEREEMIPTEAMSTEEGSSLEVLSSRLAMVIDDPVDSKDKMSKTKKKHKKMKEGDEEGVSTQAIKLKGGENCLSYSSELALDNDRLGAQHSEERIWQKSKKKTKKSQEEQKESISNGPIWVEDEDSENKNCLSIDVAKQDDRYDSMAACQSKRISHKSKKKHKKAKEG